MARIAAPQSTNSPALQTLTAAATIQTDQGVFADAAVLELPVEPGANVLGHEVITDVVQRQWCGPREVLARRIDWELVSHRPQSR
jgi:hypothetical protein